MKKISVIALCLFSLQVCAQYFQNVSSHLPSAAVGGNTMDVQVADFNGDGFPDIVLAKEYQRNRLLFNDGSGVFTDATANRLTNVSHDSEDIAIADFDGNGWPDIVFAAEDDATHEFYLNTGSGDFTDVSARLPQFVSNAVVALDVNGDSFIDLIFGNNGQNKLFINDGAGFFTDETATRLPVDGNITQDILLTDVDNDGDKDLAIGNEDFNKLLINNGSGIFTDETLARLPQGVTMETRKISRADVNGDGFDDLFYCNIASAGAPDIRDRLYLNDGTGVFTDVTATHLPSELLHTFDAVFTDLNNDGSPDLIVGYFSNMLPAAFLNDGTGHFSDHSNEYFPAAATGNNIGLFVADFNGDGEKDLYLGRFQQTDGLFFTSGQSVDAAENENLLTVYPNPTSGSFELDLTGETGPISITVFDPLGQLVYTETPETPGKHAINLAGRAAGVYILKVSGKRHNETMKILLCH